jgi:hypothetical protein
MFRRLLYGEEGIVLPIVIILFLVITLLAFSALFISNSQVVMGEKYNRYVESIHFAETGLNQYLWQLNKQGADDIAQNTILEFEDGKYAIEVAESGEGYQIVRATGWPNSDENSKRTIEALLSKRSFTEYIYLSNNDPNDIRWVTGENVYGPYHSNTELVVDGAPVFWGPASYFSKIRYYGSSAHTDPPGSHPSGHAPVFKMGVERRNTTVDFPNSNQELYDRAQQGTFTYNEVERNYAFEGRTRIMLHNNGTMTVKTYVDGEEVEYANIALPANGVIYVNGGKGITKTSNKPHTSDYASNSRTRMNTAYGNVFVSGVLKGRLTIAAANNIYITDSDPTKDSYGGFNLTDGLTYANTTFTLDENTGVVTVDKYNTSQPDDMLGLVANNCIWVVTNHGDNNNMKWFDESYFATTRSVKIYAALFAINGGFGNESIWNGNFSDYASANAAPRPVSDLIIFGSIIQARRYPVAYDTTGGFNKKYAHDPRMIYQTPPFFINPADAGWVVKDER